MEHRAETRRERRSARQLGIDELARIADGEAEGRRRPLRQIRSSFEIRSEGNQSKEAVRDQAHVDALARRSIGCHQCLRARLSFRVVVADQSHRCVSRAANNCQALSVQFTQPIERVSYPKAENPEPGAQSRLNAAD